MEQSKKNIKELIYIIEEFIKGFSFHSNYEDLYKSYNNYKKGLKTKYDYFFNIINNILNLSEDENEKWLKKINILDSLPKYSYSGIRQYLEILLKYTNKYEYDLYSNILKIKNRLYWPTTNTSDIFESGYLIDRLLEKKYHLNNIFYITGKITGNGEYLLKQYGCLNYNISEYLDKLDDKTKKSLKYINFINKDEL